MADGKFYVERQDWVHVSDKLKPCPFCGGDARLKTVCPELMPTGYKLVAVECTRCRAAILRSCDYDQWGDLEAEAIEAWNTRAERTCRNVDEVGLFKCSECGYFSMQKMVTRDRKPIDPRFCPSCGAKVVV